MIALLLLLPLLAGALPPDTSDAGLSPPEMIEKHGYPSETHWVTTDDNYTITVHRIPFSPRDPAAARPAVLLNHGLGASSADYVNMGPGRSLAYLLADRGFDVWMMNARGTSFSRNHTTLDPGNARDAPNFFAFSWHEIGFFDIPAVIDHIRGVTGDDQLHYVGHSQGCTSFLVMAATRPEYNAKIALASLMAPAAIMAHPHPVLALVAGEIKTIEVALTLLQIYELPGIEVMHALIQELCPLEEFRPLCNAILGLIGGGVDNDQFDWEYIRVIGTNTPSACAARQFYHYGQEVKAKGFNYYDFGIDKNIKLYGQATPPPYDLSKVTAPVAIYRGLNDILATPEDVTTLSTMLPKVVDFVTVDFAHFNHIDFLYAHDVVTLVYNNLIETMQKY